MVGNVQARGDFTKGWNDSMEGDLSGCDDAHFGHM